MLQIRPSCENCARDLPADSREAMICSFECTFCRDCALNQLANVCPNCGGGFCPRPVRPARNWKGDNFLGSYPASHTPEVRPVNLQAHAEFAAAIRQIPPHAR